MSTVDSVTYYCVRHKTPMQPREDRTYTTTASSVGLTGSRGMSAGYCPSCESDLTHLYRLLYEDIGFCGCGDPESAYDTIGMILALIRCKWEDPEKQEHAHWKACGELIRDQTGTTDGAFYLVLYALDHAGLLEHGGSVGGSWLTRKGSHYLDLMNTYTFGEVDGASYYPHHGEPCGPGCKDWEACLEEWEKPENGLLS